MKLVSVTSRVKCLAISYLFTTRPTRSPIAAAPVSPARPPAAPRSTMAATLASSFSVAASMSSRFFLRFSAKSGLKHTTSRSSG